MSRQYRIENALVSDSGSRQYRVDGTYASATMRIGKPWLVQSADAGYDYSDLPRSCSYPVDVTAGNLLVVCVATYTTFEDWGTVTVTDNLGQTWVQAGDYVQTASYNISLWYVNNTAGGAVTVTATPTSSDSNYAYISLAVLEYEGIVDVDPVQAVVSNTGSGDTPTTGPVTVENSGDLIVVAQTSSTALETTIAQPYSMREFGDGGGSNVALAVADDTNASDGSGAEFTLSSDDDWATIAVTFKQDFPAAEEEVTSASYTNFCCRTGGNNLNAGAVDGSTIEPAITPLATFTGGDWNQTGLFYTVPAGADMTEALVGRFASLHHDGDLVPTNNQYLIARITSVNLATRRIVLSTTARSLFGIVVANGTGNRTLRIGGAWSGPSGTSGFPLNILSQTMTSSAGRSVKINLKNEQIYSVSATITGPTTTGWLYMAGYQSSYGDGGRAILDGGTVGAAYNLLVLTTSQLSGTIEDMEFRNNGATGGSTSIGGILSGSGASYVCIRNCIFHDFRASGLIAQDDVRLVECEFYNCNVSNTAGCGGVRGSGTSDVVAVRCIFHDNVGNNNAGIVCTQSGASIEHCIFDSNGGFGFNAGTLTAIIKNCDFYNNGNSGISTNTRNIYIENCNFIKNVGYALDNSVAEFGSYVINCGFGSGTMANTLGNISTTAATDEIGSITYAANQTPWADPANGDFRITLDAAKGAGRGAFLQTAPGYAGTVGYPPIGAADNLEISAAGSTYARGRIVNVGG